MPLERCCTPYQINISVLRCCVLSSPSLLSSQKLLPWCCRCCCHLYYGVFVRTYSEGGESQANCNVSWAGDGGVGINLGRCLKDLPKKIVWKWETGLCSTGGKKNQDGGHFSYHREIPVYRWQSTMNNIHGTLKLTYLLLTNGRDLCCKKQ